jgi:hypothetical protein
VRRAHSAKRHNTRQGFRVWIPGRMFTNNTPCRIRTSEYAYARITSARSEKIHSQYRPKTFGLAFRHPPAHSAQSGTPLRCRHEKDAVRIRRIRVLHGKSARSSAERSSLNSSPMVAPLPPSVRVGKYRNGNAREVPQAVTVLRSADPGDASARGDPGIAGTGQQRKKSEKA